MGPVETLEKALAAGGIVEVQKKSGDWSKFHIASLGKPFDVDGVSMCYGYGPDDEEEGAKRLAREARSSSSQSSSGGGGGGRGGAPYQDERPASDQPFAGQQRGEQQSGGQPERDESEPLPVFQGDDEWVEEF